MQRKWEPGNGDYIISQKIKSSCKHTQQPYIPINKISRKLAAATALLPPCLRHAAAVDALPGEPAG